MRHQPSIVDAVAMKSAADLIVDAALRHFRERVAHHRGEARIVVGIVATQEQRKHERVGKLRRLPEASIDGVVRSRERMRRGDRQVARNLSFGRGVGAERSQSLRELLDIMLNFVRAALVRVGGGQQHARKAGHTLAIDRRKIGAAKKRLRIGREEHRQRPSATPGDHLHRFHVDLIEVGPLLAIDLD